MRLCVEGHLGVDEVTETLELVILEERIDQEEEGTTWAVWMPSNKSFVISACLSNSACATRRSASAWK